MTDKNFHRANDLLKKSWKQIENNDVDKNILSEIYIDVFHSAPCCLSVIENFFTRKLSRIINKQFQPLINMSQSNFKLKKGRAIYIRELGKHINSDVEFTDADARAALKQNPNCIALFDAFPSDWNKGIQGDGISKPAAPKKQPAPQEPKKSTPSKPAAAKGKGKGK